MDKNYEDDHIKTYSGLSVFERKGSPLLRDASRNLEELERKQAHLYVLRNCEEVQPFLRLYKCAKKKMNSQPMNCILWLEALLMVFKDSRGMK